MVRALQHSSPASSFKISFTARVHRLALKPGEHVRSLRGYNNFSGGALVLDQCVLVPFHFSSVYRLLSAPNVDSKQRMISIAATVTLNGKSGSTLEAARGSNGLPFHNRNRSFRVRWPNEPPTVQAFGVKRQSISVVPEDFCQVVTTTSEDVKNARRLKNHS